MCVLLVEVFLRITDFSLLAGWVLFFQSCFTYTISASCCGFCLRMSPSTGTRPFQRLNKGCCLMTSLSLEILVKILSSLSIFLGLSRSPPCRFNHHSDLAGGPVKFLGLD